MAATTASGVPYVESGDLVSAYPGVSKSLAEWIEAHPPGTGPAGVRGSKWFSGTGNPGVIPGSLPGDFYLDTDTGKVWELS